MKADLRKEQILKVAERMFSMQGYHETFVEDIIKEAKIGKGTYYRYFKNKEDIYITLLKKVLIGWEEHAFINPVQMKSDNISDLFKELIKRSLEFFAENDDLCNIYLCVNRGNDELFKPFINRFEKQMLEHISTYLKEGIKLGFVRKDLNIELTSNIIAGAYLRVGYYYFVQNKNRSRKIDMDELSDDFFNSTVKGILIK
jgi:TetR/AcrR family fatty acid metabolism transcriptional regulator